MTPSLIQVHVEDRKWETQTESAWVISSILGRSHQRNHLRIVVSEQIIKESVVRIVVMRLGCWRTWQCHAHQQWDQQQCLDQHHSCNWSQTTHWCCSFTREIHWYWFSEDMRTFCTYCTYYCNHQTPSDYFCLKTKSCNFLCFPQTIEKVLTNNTLILTFAIFKHLMFQ